MVQCHTGYCFLGNYYTKCIPPKQPACLCGTRIQSCHHIICKCTCYKTACWHLCKLNEDMSLTDVLGTKKGLQALALFLHNSNTFKKMLTETPPTKTDNPRASQ
ncbi:hypothetical protein CONPUDRAFT_63880 [Coniophora puteana RWD-64-598 SS2]|uniref:Uncharacterized protein n=1 Tax=Coniophora puteana (strain RWD-64-598) TaxID=741705 RepID=A0A5M3MBY9_CONPW|nr:uncharacterized protein CONPUDRAFT_63880 [Coniophora puteana RWD-64-598 SS2]EIW76759.1 hypothetical protein CONPUDRAFT_63880 [Coniophora puteana RWD-64-598 SS2]